MTLQDVTGKKRAHQQQFLFTASLQECLSFYLVSIKSVAGWAADAASSPASPGIPIRSRHDACSLQLSPCSAGSSPDCAVSEPHVWSMLVPRMERPLLPRAVSPEQPMQPAVSPWLQGQGPGDTHNLLKEFRYWKWIKKRDRSANGYVINLKRELTDGKCRGFKPQGVFNSA